jgi:hypothetical protein
MSDARTRRPWRLAAALLGLAAVAVTLTLSCSNRPPDPPPVVDPPPPTGELAQQVHEFCGHCHAYPPADTFPRHVWKEEVEQGYRFFGLSNLPLRPPPIDEVVRYYEERAAPELPAAVFERAAHPLPVKLERAAFPASPEKITPYASHVNLVPLSDPKRLDFLVCEMKAGFVAALRPYDAEPSWRVLARVPNPAHAEVVDLDGDGARDVLVADLGNYLPTDRRTGSVVWLRGGKDGGFTPVRLLDGVGRVADVQAADFRGVGKLDLVVACFGWRQTGEIFYLENQTEDWSRPKFVPRVLDERHGTIHLPVTDLNGDGKPDFVALISQEHETVVAFLNDGGGRFRKETVYDAPHPGYGSSGIQLADMDRDGDLDLLYTNGDVLDQPYLLKPYHSVQWLENPGPGKFPWAHHALTPMYGVHRAVAGDLDGDGDADVVATSFLPEGPFPERETRGLDSIVVLEQTAPGRFERHTLETGSCDHASCALADVFGTGRLDLVVSNFGASKVEHLVGVWRNAGK